IGSFLLPCASTGVSLLAVWCLSGATPRGQPWTPAVTLPQGCNGLSTQRMAVLWTFRELSLCRHVCRELLRNAWLDFTPIIPATACQQGNYVETYSRFRCGHECPQGGTFCSSPQRIDLTPFLHMRASHPSRPPCCNATTAHVGR